MRFAAGPAAERITVPLDSLTLVYHRPSGATHLLAPPAPELLDALAEGPADAPTLLARLAVRYDVGGGDGATILARLRELAETGLVRQA